MRQFSRILVACVLCASASAGVKRFGSKEAAPQQSAALFVGVSNFADREIAPVPFAIDDAVDLAYELSIDHQPVLVPPDRVVLALSSGEPQKPESRRKLAELLANGALRCPAERSEILRWIERQSKRIGRDGVLIISFATHGAGDGGTQRLLTASSTLNTPASTVTVGEISDILSRNDVPRSLLLIDACRERLTRNLRSIGADPRSAFVRVMASVDGEVIISAAALGGYAYDDEQRRNGVFTAAVIDGLRCGAAKDRHGFVTAETLYHYVSRQVLHWVRQNKNHAARKATEWSSEGESRKIPLSICVSRTASSAAPPPE